MAMDDREKACFRDEEITEFYKLIGEYEFWLTWGTGGQRIGIKIFDDAKGAFHFRTSHYVHTPTQASPYRTSRTTESSYIAALDRAVDSITTFYKGAISDGHQPSAKWFVRNDYY